MTHSDTRTPDNDLSPDNPPLPMVGLLGLLTDEQKGRALNVPEDVNINCGDPALLLEDN